MPEKLSPADVLIAAVNNSLDVCGPKQGKLIRDMLPACVSDLGPLLEYGDRPGMFLPLRVGVDGGKLHAGCVLTVEGRMIVCWFEGLRRRTHSTVVPLGTDVSVTQENHSNGLTDLVVLTPDVVLQLHFLERGGVDEMRALMEGTGSPPASEAATQG
jgi:hypothetical protein